MNCPKKGENDHYGYILLHPYPNFEKHFLVNNKIINLL